ncbi:MAG: hypothetical protein COA75_03595 [Cellvibrionales bacterium]|nr:MAG: hypothetical protein COA75_03595 [Cellvibrionales bacterium]
MDHTVQSTTTLLKASAFAGLLAAVVLISAILPAEYGIDPTGIGEAMGLIPLASKVDQVKGAQATEDLTYQENSVTITVPAGKGLEYKFHLVKGDSMRYAWSTTDNALFYDFHGEPDGDTSGYFESYTVSTSNNVRGTFTASFDGSHGWYWKNKSLVPIVVALKTEGQYTIIGIK